jgi:PPK2 family polyphosphate:nucleotide phosphotransferase
MRADTEIGQVAQAHAAAQHRGGNRWRRRGIGEESFDLTADFDSALKTKRASARSMRQTEDDSMSKLKAHDFRVPAGKKVDLDRLPTRVKPVYRSKKHYQKLLQEQVEELSALQRLHYASNRHAVLLIFQAMDAAGKDGAIRHVMSGVNPQGCQVFSFKHPTPMELDHDFLWRTTRSLPERGRIGIFNRSYYEEVLIVRVHPEILRTEQLPHDVLDDDDVWKERYRSIVDLEEHLYRNGTRVIKFFLHLSKEEQRKRFLERIDDPDKNWKFSLADVEERKFWKHYMKAYEACLKETSTEHAPWFVVPADDKENARLIISDIILELFKSLKMTYPTQSAERLRELQAIRSLLSQPSKGS